MACLMVLLLLRLNNFPNRMLVPKNAPTVRKQPHFETGYTILIK